MDRSSKQYGRTEQSSRSTTGLSGFLKADRRSSPTSFRTPILCAAIGQYPIAEHEPSEHDGFVIITADSAGGMVDIHDRRPVAISPELAREWLDPATPKERAEQIVLLQGEPTETFEWFKVDRAIGNVCNQGSDLIRKITSLDD